jgi:hypothetical protein
MATERNETSRFLLKTASLKLGTDDPLGKENLMGSIATFTNLNLRTIVGFDMYEKYDTFNLNIEYIANGKSTDGYLNDLLIPYVDIQVSGLNFINSTYNFALKSTTNICTMCVYEFPSSSTSTGDPWNQSHLINYTNLTGADFAKPNGENFDLTISFATLDTGKNETVVSLKSFPDMNYMFVITGVKRKKPH